MANFPFFPTDFFPDDGTAGSSSSGPVGTLATIGTGKTFARYLAIQLWPTPGSVLTYHVDYVRTIPELITATDEPLLPDDFHHLLIDGALVKEWSKKDDTRRAECKADFDEGIKALRSWVLSNAETAASLRPVMRQFSSLGPTYPSGS